MHKKIFNLLIVAMVIICLTGCDLNGANITDNPNNNDTSNEFKDIEKSDSEEKNINKMSLDQFKTFISESIENEVSSEEIEVETHFTDTGVSINFIFNTFKTKDEYKIPASNIISKIKEKCNGIYIEKEFEPFIYINFYIPKSVVKEMLDSGHMKKSIIGYKVPYEIGGCTISKSGYNYTEADFENCNRPDVINFFDYVD